MKLNQWLDSGYGRATRLADYFGLTKGAISQWRTTGVPKEKMKAVRDFTEGAVSLEEMIPDTKRRQRKPVAA